MGGTSGSMGTTTQAPADAAGSATYLTEQAENQISVNDFMGQAIYTADNQYQVVMEIERLGRVEAVFE